MILCSNNANPALIITEKIIERMTSREKNISPFNIATWFNRTKSKTKIPIISDIELSYITNSLSFLLSRADEGIATLLLIILNGMAFNNDIFKSRAAGTDSAK